MKSIILIIFALLNGVWTHTCHMRELDLCAASLLIFTQSPAGIATTDNEMNKQCVELKEADMCLRNYTKRCSTPLQRELHGFFSEGSARLLTEFCSIGSQLRKSYLKHAQCLNSAQKRQRKCVKDLQTALETIPKLEWDKRVAGGCCAYRRWTDCSEYIVEQRCGKDAVEFINFMLRMAVSRLPFIICQGYGSGNSECRRLLPITGTNPKGGRSKSILLRLFSAYTGL